MNPRILLQIKRVCGVVEMDCMLVFDEGCIRSDIWMKVHEKKRRKYTVWAFPGDVYRYTLNMYRYTLGSGHFWPRCTGTR